VGVDEELGAWAADAFVMLTVFGEDLHFEIFEVGLIVVARQAVFFRHHLVGRLAVGALPPLPIPRVRLGIERYDGGRGALVSALFLPLDAVGPENSGCYGEEGHQQ
jgi:hypothetical protein